MSLRIRFRFDGRCGAHPRYNPEKDGRPQHKDCPGCESLYVIWLYTGIAQKKSADGEGLLTARLVGTAEDPSDPHEVGDDSSSRERGEAGS